MKEPPDNRSSEERFLGGYAGWLFLVVSLGWGVIVLGRQLLPPLLPAIIADLGITPFQAGTAVTAMWASRAVNQYIGGRLADELSRKTVLVGNLAILCVGFVLLSRAFTYALFVLAAVTVGFGAGAYSVSARATGADLYVAKRGRAFGIQSGLNSLAGVGAAGGAIVVLAVATWRGAFLPIAAVLVAIAVALHFRQRDRYVVRWPDLGIVETVRRLSGDRTTRRVIAAFVLIVFSWQGIITFLPAFLQAERGLSPTLASAGFGLLYIFGVAGGPLAGEVADRVGKLRTVVGLLACGSGGLVVMLAVNSPIAVVAGILMLAVGFRSFFPVMQAYLMDTFADGSMAGDLGASKSIWSGLGSLGPSYVGWAAGHWSYSTAFAGLIGCVLLSLLLVIAIEWTS